MKPTYLDHVLMIMRLRREKEILLYQLDLGTRITWKALINPDAVGSKQEALELLYSKGFTHEEIIQGHKGVRSVLVPYITIEEDLMNTCPEYFRYQREGTDVVLCRYIRRRRAFDVMADMEVAKGQASSYLESTNTLTKVLVQAYRNFRKESKDA